MCLIRSDGKNYFKLPQTTSNYFTKINMSEEIITPSASFGAFPASAASEEVVFNAGGKVADATRGTRKRRKGKVVSKSGEKSVVVLVERRYHHPVYGKQLIEAKKYHTHDETNQAKVGDNVEIEETRPISKLKRWRLTSVNGAAVAKGAN